MRWVWPSPPPSTPPEPGAPTRVSIATVTLSGPPEEKKVGALAALRDVLGDRSDGRPASLSAAPSGVYSAPVAPNRGDGSSLQLTVVVDGVIVVHPLPPHGQVTLGRDQDNEI